MIKFLLFAVVVAVVIAFLRHGVRRKKFRAPDLTQEGMKQCSYCGVHFPANEAVNVGGKIFCSEEHRKLGAAE